MNGSDQIKNQKSFDSQATIPMENARWEQVGELFAQAIKLPPDERRKFLDEIAFDTPEIRREVEALIENAGQNQRLETIESEIFENQIIFNYKILKKLGEGGMGVVFSAMDLSLEREVALKFLPRRYNTNPAMKQRFEREARAAAALDHPNVCGVFEVGETVEGRLFIAMPFYKGKTLKEKIFDKSVTVKEAVEFAVQTAEGLAHAHQAGIVHRDIKPENILDNGRRCFENSRFRHCQDRRRGRNAKGLIARHDFLYESRTGGGRNG